MEKGIPTVVPNFELEPHTSEMATTIANPEPRTKVSLKQNH